MSVLHAGGPDYEDDGGDDYGDGDDCVDLCSDDGDDAYMVKMMMMVMMTLMLVMMGICGPGKFSKSCVT